VLHKAESYSPTVKRVVGKEAVCAELSTSHTQGGMPGLYTTVTHTHREAYLGYTPLLYTQGEAIPGLYITVIHTHREA